MSGFRRPIWGEDGSRIYRRLREDAARNRPLDNPPRQSTGIIAQIIAPCYQQKNVRLIRSWGLAAVFCSALRGRRQVEGIRTTKKPGVTHTE
jgi:hypothetical protein